MAKKKPQNYGPEGRPSMEGAEGGQSPTGFDRMQTDAQTSVGTSNVTETTPQLAVVDEVVKKVGGKLKVKPTAEVGVEDEGKLGADGLPSGAAAMASMAGFGRSTVEDASQIPYSRGGQRPSQGFPRREADNDFILNNQVSEQLEPEFEDALPLKDAGEKKMFYAGRAQFKKERGKRTYGSQPQDLLFDRSVDFEVLDATVHTTGQVLDSIEVKTKGVVDGTHREAPDVIKAGYPTVTALPNGVENVGENLGDTDDPVYGYANAEHVMRKSNYVLKSFSFTLKRDNGATKVVGLGFNEDECVSHAAPIDQEKANQNWQIDRNNVAKTVLTLQTQLGRETSDKWSGTGYAAVEPYEYATLVHDIMATEGAIMGTAYRAANSAMAFQIGLKRRKDGARYEDTAVDMFLGGIGDTTDNSAAQSVLDQMSSAKGRRTGFEGAIFNRGLYAAGSAAAIIDMFDTTGKYKSIASFFNYQKSLKYFIQTLDNNLNTFRAKKQYLMALDTAHLFSTPDGIYNPMLPVAATKNVSIVNPLSLNFFAQGFDRDKYGSASDPNYTSCGTKKHYAVKWTDLRRMTYFYGITHPVVDGLADWLVLNEAALARVYAPSLAEGSEVTITIPATFNMLYPSMWSWILAAASQRIAYAHQQAFIPYLQAEEQLGKPLFDDLTSLKDLNFKYSSNFTLTDYKTPLKVGAMKPASKIRYFYPEDFACLRGDNPGVGVSKAAYILPWYMSEASVLTRPQSDTDEETGMTFTDPYHLATMNWPSFRHGVRNEYADVILGMDMSDVRLSMDAIVSVPLPAPEYGDDTSLAGVIPENQRDYIAGKMYVPYADIAFSEDDSKGTLYAQALRTDKMSDGRVIVSYKNNQTGPKVVPTKAAIMCAPRELGFLMGMSKVTPTIISIKVLEGDGDNKKTWTGDLQVTTGGTYKMSSIINGNLGFRYIAYSAYGPADKDGLVLTQATALSQRYFAYLADQCEEATAINKKFIENVGIYPSLSALCASTKEGGGLDETRTRFDDIWEIGKTAPAKNLGGTALGSCPRILSLARAFWTLLNRTYRPIDIYQSMLADFNTEEGQPDNMTLQFDPMETAFYFGLCGFLAADYSQEVLDRAEKIQQLQLFYTEDDFISRSPIFRAD